MPLRFTLRQLEYFVAVGECGSIALAAEKVNVSSPSISAAIGQLEHEFGLQLFARKHARGLALSQAGLRFMGEAKAVLAQAGRLNELANELTGQVRGPLNIGCLLTFAQLVLPRLRRSFGSRWPEVQVTQQELDQARIFDLLRQGAIDVALTYDLSIPVDLNFEPLMQLPPYAILSDSHPLAERRAVSASELCAYPMVLLDLPFSTDYFLSFFDGLKKRPIIAERTQDMAVLRSLVANGFGYSLVNIRPLSDQSPDGKPLRFVPIKGKIRPMTVGLLTAQGGQSLATVRAFVDHCKNRIKTGSLPGMNLQGKGGMGEHA